MTNKKEKKRFAGRFSLDDWMMLCGKLEFLDALDESIAMAEVLAHRILNPSTKGKAK